MNIFDSTQDLRVVVRTPEGPVLDTRVAELWGRDQLGELRLDVNSDPMLAALVPSELVLHKRDGSTIVVRVSWGSLTAVADQVRIVVRSASRPDSRPRPLLMAV
jgi:F0F1-type ATP synthase epsilon subunit